MQNPGDKSELRRQARGHLALIGPDRQSQASQHVCLALDALSELQRVVFVLAFSPLAREVDIRPWSRRALARGTRLALPRVNWQTGAVTPHEVASVDSGLVLVRHGISEPPAEAPQVPLAQLDAILVPGLAFDASGTRLGRGGGFYDRLLARAEARTLLVGVCFDVQIVDCVPREAHDQPVHLVVTERRVIRPRTGRNQGGL